MGTAHDDEHAIDLEAEVVVEPRGPVALDDEPPAPTGRAVPGSGAGSGVFAKSRLRRYSSRGIAVSVPQDDPRRSGRPGFVLRLGSLPEPRAGEQQQPEGDQRDHAIGDVERCQVEQEDLCGCQRKQEQTALARLRQLRSDAVDEGSDAEDRPQHAQDDVTLRMQLGELDPTTGTHADDVDGQDREGVHREGGGAVAHRSPDGRLWPGATQRRQTDDDRAECRERLQRLDHGDGRGSDDEPAWWSDDPERDDAGTDDRDSGGDLERDRRDPIPTRDGKGTEPQADPQDRDRPCVDLERDRVRRDPTGDEDRGSSCEAATDDPACRKHGGQQDPGAQGAGVTERDRWRRHGAELRERKLDRGEVTARDRAEQQQHGGQRQIEGRSPRDISSSLRNEPVDEPADRAARQHRQEPDRQRGDEHENAGPQHDREARQDHRRAVHRDQEAEGTEPRSKATVPDDPHADGGAGKEERQCPAPRIEEREAARRHLTDGVQRGDGHAGEQEEDRRRGCAVGVPTPDSDPRQGNRLGGPGDRHRWSAELDRHRHGEGGDARSKREQTEQVPLAVPRHEEATDREMGGRDGDQEQAAVRDRVTTEHRKAGPHGKRDIPEEQRGR